MELRTRKRAAKYKEYDEEDSIMDHTNSQYMSDDGDNEQTCYPKGGSDSEEESDQNITSVKEQEDDEIEFSRNRRKTNAKVVEEDEEENVNYDDISVIEIISHVLNTRERKYEVMLYDDRCIWIPEEVLKKINDKEMVAYLKERVPSEYNKLMKSKEQQLKKELSKAKVNLRSKTEPNISDHEEDSFL